MSISIIIIIYFETSSCIHNTNNTEREVHISKKIERLALPVVRPVRYKGLGMLWKHSLGDVPLPHPEGLLTVGVFDFEFFLNTFFNNSSYV